MADERTTTPILDPNGNEWDMPSEIVALLGFNPGQRLTKPQMDNLLNEIMAQVEVSLSVKPARAN
jgi:hypothetical protein